jgi:hypothetical protein
MLEEMAFEEQLLKLSGDELTRFVARHQYQTAQQCSVCVDVVTELNAKIGEFDPKEKGSLDSRLTAIETRDRRHLQMSTAAGAGGGAGLSILLQALWALVIRK